MSKATKEIGELSFSQKFSRLRVRLGSAKWRRYGMLLLAGKALGILVLFSILATGYSAWEWITPSPSTLRRRNAFALGCRRPNRPACRSIQGRDRRRHH